MCVHTFKQDCKEETSAKIVNRQKTHFKHASTNLKQSWPKHLTQIKSVCNHSRLYHLLNSHLVKLAITQRIWLQKPLFVKSMCLIFQFLLLQQRMVNMDTFRQRERRKSSSFSSVILPPTSVKQFLLC